MRFVYNGMLQEARPQIRIISHGRRQIEVIVIFGIRIRIRISHGPYIQIEVIALK